MNNTDLTPSERIARAIYLIRGEKVMLDRDLAKLYGVPTGALNQQCGAIASVFLGISCQLMMAEVRQLNLSQTVIGSGKHRALDFGRMLLPNRAWQCYQACYEASEQ